MEDRHVTRKTGAWEVFDREVVPRLRDRWQEVFGGGLKRHQKGRDWRGPCPIHGGDNPDAFSVDPGKLTWCCYTGCEAQAGQTHAGGGVIDFVVRRDGVNKKEAAARLARLVGVDLDAARSGGGQQAQQLDGEALRQAWARWCSGRKLNPAAVLRGSGGKLLAYRNRPALSFPTPRGLDRIRYLDSGKPKTQWRGKGGGPCWYGLSEALQLDTWQGVLYLVNGEPSVWACLQSGVPAVCTCSGEGAKVPPEMLAELLEITRTEGARVVVVFDLDRPGRRAAKAWVAMLHSAGFQEPRALVLPEELGEGGDVDDLHRRTGDDGLAAALAGLATMKVETPRPVVANFIMNGDDRIEVDQGEVVEAVHRATGGWPRVCNGLLFAAGRVEDGKLPGPEAIRMLDGRGAQAKIFAWLRKHARVEWCGREVLAADRMGSRSPLGRPELVRALEMEAPVRYDAIEALPHHPPMVGAYYSCGNMPSGDGSALREFMALLNPDSEVDAGMLKAALVTPGWGGGPGCRPGFVFTSEHGVGSGKTATAVAISGVWGGAVRLQPDTEDWATTVQRLLSDAALSLRCVLIDNLRGRLASGSIESAITEEVISGKRMYHGEFSRPGTLSWMLTVNVAELSRDLADRCVVIKIGPPRHGVDFRAQVADFLERRRYDLVCDCLAFLRGPRLSKIDRMNRDRWQAWQEAILTRMPNGNDVAAAIIARRPAVDFDACEAQDIKDTLAALLRARGHCPEHEAVFVPFNEARELLESDLGTRSKTGFGRKLKVACQQGPLRSVTPGYRHRYFGSGLLWHPTGGGTDSQIRRLNPDSGIVRCVVCTASRDESGHVARDGAGGGAAASREASAGWRGAEQGRLGGEGDEGDEESAEDYFERFLS